jgi:hypothetical protein
MLQRGARLIGDEQRSRAPKQPRHRLRDDVVGFRVPLRGLQPLTQ